MDTDSVLAAFRDSGALLEGHFLLSSGLHSPVYLQCAKVLERPERAARLCGLLASRLRARFGEIPLIVAPAMGGVIAGHEVARALGSRSIFAERVGGHFAVRRGFTIAPGERVVMIEDVITTGLSSRECIDAISRAGGRVVGAGCLIDRSGGRADIGVPLIALATLDAPVYKADALPADLEARPAVKPGSRGLS